MTAVHRLNGRDCADLDWYLDAEVGLFGAPTRTRAAVGVFGRAGAMLGAPAQTPARPVTLRGTLAPAAGTIAARVAAEDALKDALASGLVRLELDTGHDPARQLEGYVEGVEVRPTGHPWFGVVATVEARLVCPSPFFRDVEPTTRALAVAGTRYTVPLGTAPSSPIIRIMGAATTPTLTYRDAGGAARRSMVLATLAADEYLDIDMGTGTVTFYDSGVSASGLAKVTSGDFPWALDPQDGDYGTGAWPTVEVSAGSGEVLWWREWL